MYDLISIGGISVDLFFKGESLTFRDGRFQLAIGGKYVPDYFHTSIGGGGANVAIGGSHLGMKTAVMGKIGNNQFKKIIIDQLDSHSISHRLCDIEDDYWNISTILLADNGERSIINYNTPHQHLVSERNELTDIFKTKMAYLGNLPDVSLHERIALLRFFKHRKVMTVLNIGIKDCRRPKDQLFSLLNAADIIIVNGHEFAEIVKAPYKDIHFRENVIQWYIPYLNDQIIVVTEGAKGSYTYYNGKIYHQIAIRPERIVDTTGTGDGYCAGFIAGYLQSGNIAASMEKGAKYAAKILAKIGAN